MYDKMFKYVKRKKYFYSIIRSQEANFILNVLAFLL